MSEPPKPTGYQGVEEWMGEQVLTLADVWPDQPRAMIVGLNPAPSSVTAGHYYQGTVGQRQLRRLVEVGVLGRPDGTFFERAALERGVGFTDLVKRPTPGEDSVTRAEIEHGRAILVERLAARRVPLVICVFRHPVQALLGQAGKPGYQDLLTPWGGRVFRMPGPFEGAGTVAATLAVLALPWISPDRC